MILPCSATFGQRCNGVLARLVLSGAQGDLDGVCK